MKIIYGPNSASVEVYINFAIECFWEEGRENDKMTHITIRGFRMVLLSWQICVQLTTAEITLSLQ